MRRIYSLGGLFGSYYIRRRFLRILDFYRPRSLLYGGAIVLFFRYNAMRELTWKL